ncbi:CREB-regulated transcription coactivator 2 isoform X2 [Esox lucius]|uniref:CREB-regulated transcription coactivator 2 isoform X2 n=1 Tax=Esox lucius TaxID=8010 RepID=UPI00147785E3|nr:CREB-regulated transcription coactivator 2 isoform X2 [Esox lucius]
MFMAGTGNGGCGVGQSPGSSSGSCNPRKFSEKIALLTQRQAEDTAAFQEVMMDITSTRIQVQRARQSRSLGPFYGGSLPNVNQIGRSTSDVQGQLSCSPDNGCPTRLLHSMAERTQGEGRLSFPVRPNRRHTDNSPYRSLHLSPPPEPSWRRNWSSSSPVDKIHLMPPSITQLNRTNSDSALHTSVRNTHTGDQLSPNQHALMSRNRHSVFPYPVPPIEENVIEEGNPLRNPTKVSTGMKSHKLPGTNVLSLPDQQYGALLNVPSVLNGSGSLPDLSSLHLPSPQPTGLDYDKHSHSSCLITASSTGQLSGTSSHLGASEDEFPLPGLQGSFSNPLLQSSHSNPNILSSLSSHSLSSSLSSTSLNLSLSNPSLQSSPSNQSLQSFLSNSSLSGQSLQSATSHCSYSSGFSGSRSCSSSSLSCSPRPSSQAQVPLSRRRTPLSPLVLPTGGESRWLQSKQFSPVGSPTLSSITQGVLLNTNQLPKESRPPAYPQRQTQPEYRDMHVGPSQRQPPLTEGLQQPRPEHKEPPPPRGALWQQQDVCVQHQVLQTHSVPALQYQQQHQHPNQLRQCQFQQVQTEGQDPDIKQQRQRLSNHCENPVQQNLRQPQQQQHQRPQHQKPVYQNLPHQQQETQRPQHQPHPHQHHPPQQAYQPGYGRQPPQQACQRPPRQALQQDELLQEQLLQHFQLCQQQPHEQRRRHPHGACLPARNLDLNGQNISSPQMVPTMQVTRKHQTQGRGRSSAHQKVHGQKDQIQSTEISSQMSSFTDNDDDSSVLDPLQHESYIGLHLTPSQTQALSQQLGQLSKEPLASNCGAQSLVGKDGSINCGNWAPKMSLYSQNQSSVDCHSVLVTGQTTYEDFSSVLPMLGFDADPFSLDNPLQIDPLDLEELNMLADGDMIDDTVKGHCSNLLR